MVYSKQQNIHIGPFSFKLAQDRTCDTIGYLIDKRISAQAFVCSNNEYIETIQASDEKLKTITDLLKKKKRTKEEDTK